MSDEETVTIGQLLDNAAYMEKRFGAPVALDLDALKSAYQLRQMLKEPDA